MPRCAHTTPGITQPEPLRCGNHAVEGGSFCWAHDPALVVVRALANVRANETRRRKAESKGVAA